MIGLDTNVLVRYITQDDPRQAAAASRLIEDLTTEQPGFVSLVSIVELAWVLSTSYDVNRARLVEVLRTLLQTKEIVVQEAEAIWQALRLFAGSQAHFADCLIERSSARAGCERTMTFDRAAAKGCGMMLMS